MRSEGSSPPKRGCATAGCGALPEVCVPATRGRLRLRDVLGFQIGDGTAQIMKTVIARTRAGRKAVPA
jgi:hypothetical protein